MGLIVTPERFREMRLEMNFTQVQIAKWFGVAPLQVLRWERGRSGIPGAAKILMWLLYEEQVRGNKRAMKSYLEQFNKNEPRELGDDEGNEGRSIS